MEKLSELSWSHDSLGSLEWDSHHEALLSPAALYFVRELLREPQHDRPIDVLTLGEALEELSAVCSALSDGRGPQEGSDRRSLFADLQLAVRNSGPAIRGELEPGLIQALLAARPLPAGLDEVSAGLLRDRASASCSTALQACRSHAQR